MQSHIRVLDLSDGGALVALHERVSSGLGQHVDVSAQQAAMIATQGYVLATSVGASPSKRIAGA